jgi:hypothetical protein
VISSQDIVSAGKGDWSSSFSELFLLCQFYHSWQVEKQGKGYVRPSMGDQWTWDEWQQWVDEELPTITKDDQHVYANGVSGHAFFGQDLPILTRQVRCQCRHARRVCTRESVRLCVCT